MKNKASNKFKFRNRLIKNTLFSQQRLVQGQDDHQAVSSNGFSFQYLSLAKRFNVKILPNKSLEKTAFNFSKDNPDQKSKTLSKLRLKTDFAKVGNRYKIEYPTNLEIRKPQSMSVNEKSPQNSYRSYKHMFFRPKNMTTIYNEQSFQQKINNEAISIEPQHCIQLQLKQGVGSLMQLGNHCRKLLNIKKSLQKQQLIIKQVVKQIKQYILNEQGCSISKIDKSFQTKQQQLQIKKLVILQRMILISIVSNCISQKIEEYIEEFNRSIQIALGFWYEIITNTYKTNVYQLQIQYQSQIKITMQMLSDAKLMTKSHIKLLIETLMQKIPLFFKNNKQFYSKIEALIHLSQDFSINRTFYELLTLFANFVTDLQDKLHINIDFVSFFATCPSPYLIKPSKKAYSLVVDLDGTLLYTKMINKAKNQYQTFYRPGCFEFIEQLSKYYQIIVFTTSVQNYAKDVTKGFNFIDHFLFRQHAVRVKGGFIKDISRIGRNLNKVVILDDLSNNFKLQKQNGLKIKSWQGQPNDNELQKMKEILLKIVKNNSNDIKSELNSYRQNKEKKKVSFSNTPFTPKQLENMQKF